MSLLWWLLRSLGIEGDNMKSKLTHNTLLAELDNILNPVSKKYRTRRLVKDGLDSNQTIKVRRKRKPSPTNTYEVVVKAGKFWLYEKQDGKIIRRLAFDDGTIRQINLTGATLQFRKVSRIQMHYVLGVLKADKEKMKS